jgi:Tol biopolymer transport system component
VFSAEVRGVPQLFTFGADGRGLRQVTHAPLGAEHASWSPDGKYLVCVLRGERADLIYRANANGGGLTRLSPPCAGRCVGDGFPVYSRDGSKIAFERDSIQTGALGSIGVDGSSGINMALAHATNSS